MKRWVIALLVAAVAGMALLSGCTGRSEVSQSSDSSSERSDESSSESSSQPESIVSGTTWIVSGGTQDGVEVTREQLEMALGGEISYTFREDGKLLVQAGDQSGEGSWTETEGVITIKVGDTSAVLTMAGETLITAQKDISVELTRK